MMDAAVDVRDQLAGVCPEALRARLGAGPGWRLSIAGGPLTFEWRGGVWAHASGLQADVDVELDADHAAARLRIALTNPTDRPSPGVSAVEPLHLVWPDLGRDGMEVRSVTGGIHAGYYPPHAFRVDDVVVLPNPTGPGRVEGGPYRIESGPDGRSSNGHLPVLQMRVRGSGLVAALEWSGLWYQQIRTSRWDQDVVWSAGIPVDGMVLAPGERLLLPTVHLVFFDGDLDAGASAFRRYVYDRICPDLGGRRPIPPVSYDTWFGIFNEFDEPLLRRQVDRAAELGLEYFALDAGWFAGCGSGSNFSIGVGNLGRVDPVKFPHGLEPLADYVHSRGLKLGLWLELERAHRESDLAREHADWLIDVGDPFLHVDFSIPAVQEHIIELVSGWIRRLGLDWSRWDYNFGPKRYWEHADPTGKIQFGYLAGLYRVLDTLMARHPSWLTEACAGGGRRIDLGTLRRCHTVWFSDYTGDAAVCRAMQSGANRFLPGHLPNSAVCTWLNAGGAGLTDADVVSRMCGALSFNGDIASWPDELTARVARLVAIYRDFRHLLVGDFQPLTPQPARPEDGEAVQFTKRDGSDAVVLAFRGLRPMDEFVVHPRSLDPRARYLVSDPLGEDHPPRQGADLVARGLTLSVATGAAIRRLRRMD